jgi:hypothetical protein
MLAFDGETLPFFGVAAVNRGENRVFFGQKNRNSLTLDSHHVE